MLHPILNACRPGVTALLFTCACAGSVYGQTGSRFHVATTLTSAGAPANAQGETKPKGKGRLMVYIGTYTSTRSKGIYIFRLDPATGELTEAGVSPEVASPSFVVVHPNH